MSNLVGLSLFRIIMQKWPRANSLTPIFQGGASSPDLRVGPDKLNSLRVVIGFVRKTNPIILGRSFGLCDISQPGG